MPYDNNKDANAGLIGKQYKNLLEGLRVLHRRTVRGELEHLIQQAAEQEGVEADDNSN